jgi:outer membrane receptor for ferrienterochelin and colicin
MIMEQDIIFSITKEDLQNEAYKELAEISRTMKLMLLKKE